MAPSVPLTTELLIKAYANGYFPMADPETGEIGWYRPNPRAILPLDAFHVSRSLRKKINQKVFQVAFDQNFRAVVDHCARREETWISSEIARAYEILHQEGLAHSAEVYEGDTLVGGVYGVSLNAAFFAESKFHLRTDASKIALYSLVQHLRERGYLLLEVQFLTPHLQRLGATEVSTEVYEGLLDRALSTIVQF